MKRLTDIQIDDIIKRYQAGEQSKDIATIHNIRDNSVARILRKHGIDRTKIKHLSQPDIDKAVKMYVEDKVSSEIIANQFDVDAGVIRRAIKKAGIEMRPATENKRQYKIDENFFEKIDTEASAYFLGLLYADGNIGKDGNNINIGLQASDIHILETFSNIIYGFLKLEDNRHAGDGKYFNVNIYCKKMHDDLIKLGCTPKKSFTITFPTNDIVPDNLMHHFIRGFMDGDGCICITNNKRPRVDFTSALPFLEGLASYLKQKLGLDASKPSERHKDRDTNTRNIQIQGFDKVRVLLDFLYTDATYFINRKYDKYIEMIKQQTKHKSKKEEKYRNANNYGTTYIHEYDGIVPNTINLLSMSDESKDKLIDPIFKFYRSKGFPDVIISDDEIIKKFAQLKNIDVDKIKQDNILYTNNNDANVIFKHFSPHFYETKRNDRSRPSVLEAFYDDDMLKNIIKNRLYGNHNMNGNTIRRGIVNSRLAARPSIFNTATAFALYKYFTKENDIIYDYSMGFGQRLISVLSLPYNIHYIGTDPFEKSVKSNQNIYEFCKKYGITQSTTDLRCIGSEDFVDEQYIGKVNLALSSPPYYNMEIYEENQNQATSLSYADFLDKYWRPTVKNIDKLLTLDGKFVIDIANKVDDYNIGENMINVVREFGFVLEDTFYLKLSRNLIFEGQKEEHKMEPIYVFRRK